MPEIPLQQIDDLMRDIGRAGYVVFTQLRMRIRMPGEEGPDTYTYKMPHLNAITPAQARADENGVLDQVDEYQGALQGDVIGVRLVVYYVGEGPPLDGGTNPNNNCQRNNLAFIFNGYIPTSSAKKAVFRTLWTAQAPLSTTSTNQTTHRCRATAWTWSPR